MLDRAAARGDLAQAVRAAAANGIDWIQVRERGLDGRELLTFTEEMATAARAGAPAAKVVVNRRVDVCLACRADGVHLGFDGVAVADARRLLGDDALIGVSTHDAEELRATAGASYAHLAPIWDPLSKARERPALGPAGLREAVSAASVPVLAQGGVDASNAAEAVAAGAAGVAVTGAILGAEDPGRAAVALRAALDTLRPDPL